MAERQYVSVEFNPGDRRAYAYHNDGPPVAVGDQVIVETKRGDATVRVVAIVPDEPPFETKAIKQKVVA
jgi:hypothetical protein